MLTAALVALTLAPAVEPQYAVAYAARFYFEGNRKSSDQIYLSTLDGKRRRAITATSAPKWGLGWLSPNRLAWMETTDREARVVEHDLATGKSKVVVRVPDRDGLMYETKDRSRGSLSLITGQSRWTGTASGWRKAPMSEDQIFGGNGFVELGADTPRRAKLGRETFILEEGEDDWIFTWGNYRVAVPLRDETPVAIRVGARPSEVFLHYGYFGASAGSQESIGRIDGERGTLTPIIQEKNAIDFLPGKPVWAALDGGRPMVKLKDGRHVWSSQVWIGDLRSGKQWTITPNPVFATSVALRP